VLLVGVHREELAFGDRVAEGLAVAGLDILRIPEGLSGRRPRQDQIFHYQTLHRELYRQILAQVAGRYRLAIDLHSGTDAEGPSADLISADWGLLDCAFQGALLHFGETQARRLVRPVALAHRQAETDRAGTDRARTEGPGEPRARTALDPEVWARPDLAYAAIELYLQDPERPDDQAIDLARWAVRALADCAAHPPP
jgi:hypothetical protein